MEADLENLQGLKQLVDIADQHSFPMAGLEHTIVLFAERFQFPKSSYPCTPLVARSPFGSLARSRRYAQPTRIVSDRGAI
jgi:hypothetical protein